MLKEHKIKKNTNPLKMLFTCGEKNVQIVGWFFSLLSPPQEPNLNFGKRHPPRERCAKPRLGRLDGPAGAVLGLYRPSVCGRARAASGPGAATTAPPPPARLGLGSSRAPPRTPRRGAQAGCARGAWVRPLAGAARPARRRPEGSAPEARCAARRPRA